LCDYVDIGTLQTLAGQYAVPLRPEEIEASSTRKDGRSAEIGVGATKGAIGQEDTEGHRLVYRVRFDPHILTELVINAVDSRDNIRDDLAAVPTVGVKEIEALVEMQSEIPTTAALLEGLIAAGKREQFEAIGRGSDYLLVDATWTAHKEDLSIALQLAELQSSDSVVTMPSSVALRVRVPVQNPGPEDLITSQGRQRLFPGARIRATVFGRPAFYDGSSATLYLSPVAVFSRVGKSATTSSCVAPSETD
ncbi:MAG TPA: hypothetical protein VGW38_07505, partial [Chloroflexota bacterium]|nr:hypothetical protein [Chloroflexota bacterium]